MSFAREVWDALSRIDISDHTEQMSGPRGLTMTYLPWHKAWLIVKRLFPASTYYHEPDILHPDGSMEVGVHVTIDSGEEGEMAHSYARLAVMDPKFNAILNPHARDINDSRQRALVKALAFMGLGLSLWDAGSQVPVGVLADKISSKQAEELSALLKATGSDGPVFLQWAGVEKLEDLPLEKFNSAKRLLAAKQQKRNSK